MEGEAAPPYLRANSLADQAPYRVLGFLSGSAAAGAAVYYYVLGEYRTANEMLSEDIYVRFRLPLFA